MSFARRLLPQPYLSLAILALWLALAPAPSLGQTLLGAALGLAIPWATRRFWPDPPRRIRPIAAAVLFARVVVDIVVANWQVARLVLGPVHRLRPAFVEVPLDIEDPLAATILGSIVSLTPGTVSVDVESARRVLLVHALDVPDRAQMIAEIKARYEAPLKEVLGC